MQITKCLMLVVVMLVFSQAAVSPLNGTAATVAFCDPSDPSCND